MFKKYKAEICDDKEFCFYEKHKVIKFRALTEKGAVKKAKRIAEKMGFYVVWVWVATKEEVKIVYELYSY